MSHKPDVAMVLAAGLGQRMRPLTDRLPKPLVPLAGRALIDRVLDRLGGAGIARAVVNVHYKAEMIEAHLAGRSSPRIVISDERDALLDTGGGVRRALGLLGDRPFLIHNSDSVWIEDGAANIPALMDAFDETRMDTVLLLARRESSLGYSGRGDFDLGEQGQVRRPAKGETVPYVFAGVSIAHPRLMRETPEGAFSLNRVWDRALAAGRVSAIVMQGTWMHVGDPTALAEAEALIQRVGEGR